MRILLVLIAVVCLAGYAGWVTYTDSGEQAAVIIDKQKASDDINKAVESVKQTTESAVDTVTDETEDSTTTEQERLDEPTDVDVQSNSL